MVVVAVGSGVISVALLRTDLGEVGSVELLQV